MRTFILTIMLVLFSQSAAAQDPREWFFRVLLDGKEIGSQFFRVWQEDGKTRLETEAEMHVKILFATVYRYRHRNEETWNGDCLGEIRSDTKANRKEFSVRGEQKDGFFELQGSSGEERLPECVMSFAYWKPDFLQQDFLLNQQDGKYLDIEVEGPFAEQISLRDSTVQAQRYHLNADKVDLKLWYTPDDEWLALESKTERGSTLRYEPR